MGWVLATALLWAAGPAVGADRSERQEREDARWVPAASFFSMGMPQRRRARAEPEGLEDDVLKRQSGESTGFPWTVGGAAEIATPAFSDLPGRPRLFAHADVSYGIDTRDPVLNSGNAGDTPELVLIGPIPTTLGVENVGQTVRAEAKPLILSGGIGTIFSFEAWERNFHIRPSIEWMYQRDTINTYLGAAESEGPDPTLCEPTCRYLFIDAQTEKGFHSVGPGIEAEIDAARTGDFLISFYGGFRAYRIVGDRKADLNTLGAWQTFDGSPTAREDTEFRTRYERKPWHYRFGFGFRFSWLPD
jgi:hypothetical protein